MAASPAAPSTVAAIEKVMTDSKATGLVDITLGSIRVRAVADRRLRESRERR